MFPPNVASQPKKSALLSPAEETWLEQHGQNLRYAPLPNYPPIEFVDENGIHKGVTADYISIIEEKIGVRFKKVYLNTWEEIFEATRQGNIDILGNLQNTAKRSEFIYFTQPYIKIPNVIIVQTKAQDKLSLLKMGGMRIAVVRGYSTIPFIKSMQPDIIIHPVDSDEQGLEMVSFGQVDAMITDLSVASFIINKLGINNLKVAGNIKFDWNMCIGSNKEYPILHKILEKALASIDQPNRQGIYKKWIHHNINPEFNWTLIITIISAIFISIVLVLAWNFSLKRQVKKQTMIMKHELDERKRITADLGVSEEKFRLIFEHSPFALVHLDKQGIVTACNNSLCKILGSSHSQIIGFNSLQSLVDKKMLKAITHALEGKKSRYEGVYLSITGNVKTPIRAVFAPITSSDGIVNSVIGILEDISERLDAENKKKKLEAQLRQSQKMEAVGTLSSGIAHDFNNILGIILGNTDLAIARLPDSQKAMTELQRIKTACLRAADITRQLLIFSRKTDPIQKTVHLNELVKESINLIRASIPAIIEIQSTLPDKIKPICADPTQIHQIVLNLCTNAAHSMEKSGGVLKIMLSEIEIARSTLAFSQKVDPGKYIELTVSDSGDGIDPKILNKIFDPYFTTKPVGKGTGIGLSIVQGIVKITVALFLLTANLEMALLFVSFFQ
ncbi:MAG: transporter substrate-binding domain-containing protein [Pseudomonadota bacterium]